MVECVILCGQTLMVLTYIFFKKLDIQGWVLSPRGAGYLFGGDITDEFNRTNNIELICRAH